ncbi:MAG TPA: penicillin acylase family protein [Actinomycetota bacterium]
MSADFVEQLRGSAAAAALPTSGELVVPGLEHPVGVRFDGWGVPYVEARSLDDLWFAQGFLSAGERLFQIDLALRAANGRLSEVFADRTLDDDRFARTVGFHRAGATIAAGWDAGERAMLERFISGVHAWIERMPAPPVEYALLDLGPDLPSDVDAWASCWAYLAWGLSGNADLELLRARLTDELGPELARALAPSAPAAEPAIAAGGLAGRLLGDVPFPPPGQGSNNWAVSGSRTASGKPLLANDPHLMVQQPAAWLEFHLRAPGYEARGVALPFFPSIALGTTAHHAWGVTNVTGDVQDLFLERLNDDRSAAMYEGAWEPLEVRREEIRVRGSAEPAVVEVRETRHGPILESYVVGSLRPEFRPLSETYALAWVGREHGVRPSTFLAAARARSFEEFREAAHGLACPGQNFVYADVDGTIGYQLSGLYPVRRSGDGTVPVPGWTAEHEWTGWIPFEDLPWSMDPERGYLVTANNQPYADDFPHLIGRDFHSPKRARRITDLLEAKEGHTVDSLRAIQLDTASLAARAILERVKEPPAPLAGWDFDLRADAVEAAFFARWVDEIARRVLGDRPALLEQYLDHREAFVCGALPTLLDESRVGPEMLDDAARAAGSADPVGWGDLHRVRFVHPLGRLPGLEALFVAAEFPIGGDEQTVNQGGFDALEGAFVPSVVASWRAVFDLDDLDRSVGVLTTGQSGNPASRHWNDQAPLWAAGEHKPLPFSEAAVAAATVSTLSLLPG